MNRLSFELGEGETLAIVGESGSGKSLTALALMQLLPPSARIAGGRVQFAGRDLIGLDAPEMRKLRCRGCPRAASASR
nr:ATP-binding cassette domain-containing protein [Mesorhizobium sp. M1E.F.Ca.ET.041.01.1.1]